MAAIGIVVTANVFGEFVLCGRADAANGANILRRCHISIRIAVLAAIDAQRTFGIVIVFVRIVVVVGQPIIGGATATRIAKFLAQIHRFQLPQIFTSYNVTVFFGFLVCTIAILIILVHIGIAGSLFAFIIVTLLAIVRLERFL